MLVRVTSVYKRQVRYLRRADYSYSSILLALITRGLCRVRRILCHVLALQILALESSKYGHHIVKYSRKAIVLVKDARALIEARFLLFMDTATPPQKRTVALATVGSVHLLLALLLLAGLQLRQYANSNEVVMTLGGAIGQATTISKLPKFMEPRVSDVKQPDITTEDMAETNGGGAQGSTNLTIPAEAIAEQHAFPPLPSAYVGLNPKFVRLTIFITEGGNVSGATVLQSSGNDGLDEFVINWVKMNWRYRPALRNGSAISVTTTAIVLFSHV